MLAFLLKKTFFDLWDNLYKIVFINLGFILSMVLFAVLSGLPPVLSMAASWAGILWCSVYLAAAAESVRTVSDYGSFDFAGFFRSLKSAWPGGIVMGLFACLIRILGTAVIPFYLGMNSMTGFLLAACVFWTAAAGVLSFQFFFAVLFRMDSRITGAVKKTFFIFLDNPGLCFFSLFFATAALTLSVFLVFLIPGPGGVLLYLDEALRVQLLKYRWLQAHPGTDRRKIPWKEILAEDREKTGNRSFKTLIFPWKD